MTTVAATLHFDATPLPSCAAIHSVVQRAIDEQRLVGAVVLVARDGHLIHQQAAGYADREEQRAMAVDSVFRLASVTKPLVCAAALVLVAQGRLHLDGPIEAWLPEFQPRLANGQVAQITLRQLLSHTAGLSYGFLQSANGPYARAGVSDGLDGADITLRENLRRIASVPLLFEPGTAWCYSLATDVLGALIESVQGKPLAVAIKQLVADPLGMTDSGFFSDARQRLATPYVNGPQSPQRLGEGQTVPECPGQAGVTFSPARIHNPHAFASGGAGMAGTAPDFLRFLEALRQRSAGGLLPDDLVAAMAQDQTHGKELPDIPGFGFGLGFAVLRNPALAASPASPGTWRWGGVYGHSWFVDPLQRISVVAFTNTLYEGMSGRFVNELRDAVYAE